MMEPKTKDRRATSPKVLKHGTKTPSQSFLLVNYLLTGYQSVYCSKACFWSTPKPLGTHKSLADYANLLLARHAITQFKRGAIEVHIIFDNPGRLKYTPKYFEQVTHDVAKKPTFDHYCDDLQGSTKIPNVNWQDNILSFRECKRRLVKFLGTSSYFLNNLWKHLQVGQTLIQV